MPALKPQSVALFRLRTTVALAASLLALAAHAQMYRWVDERGVTNVSDSVPDKYKAVAQRVDTTQFDTGEAQRRASARRAALPASGAASASMAASAAAATPGTLSPSAPASAANADDCPAMQRRYREAQKCFGPAIMTRNGNVNSARSPQCPNVVDPEPKCGPDPLQK